MSRSVKVMRNSNRLHHYRNRGVSMLEVVLGLGVFLSVMGVIASILSDEKAKQDEIMLASEQDKVLAAARLFVQRRYSDILLDLYDAADAGGTALRAFDLDVLVDNAYLPETFNGGVLKTLYDQEYAILARAVDLADGPGAPTLTFGEIDLSGAVNPVLIDGDETNGEMRIEALLVTYGGEPLLPGTGGDVVGRLQSAYGGFLNAPDVSSGAYGSFELDISPFASLPEYPSKGRFADIVALSTFGVLGEDDGDSGPNDAFRRCAGVTPGTIEYNDCLGTNEVYSDFVLRPYDSDGDGTVDQFPALRNVSILDCADGSESGADSAFRIDCSSTSISGNLVVEGTDNRIGNLETSDRDLTFNGYDFVRTKNIDGTDESVLKGERMVVDGVGQGDTYFDVGEAILYAGVIRSDDTIEKPNCPATTVDGTISVRPRIYATPAGYSDPYGRPVVGVRSFAVDEGSNWRLKMIEFVSQDFCTSSVASPLPSTMSFGANGAPNHSSCSTFDGAGNVITDRSDGKADAYLLDSAYGASTVQTRCY